MLVMVQNIFDMYGSSELKQNTNFEVDRIRHPVDRVTRLKTESGSRSGRPVEVSKSLQDYEIYIAFCLLTKVD